MGRLLLILALPLSLVVPGGLVAVAVTSSSSDEQSIQMPVAPSPVTATGAGTPSTTKPQTEAFKLFDGKTVQITPGCLDGRGTDEKKQRAISAANKLPRLKQTALNAERDLSVPEREFKAFLDQHPENTLATADYATYQTLKAAYKRLDARVELAWNRYNKQTDVFNKLADAFNADLEACKLG